MWARRPLRVALFRHLHVDLFCSRSFRRCCSHRKSAAARATLDMEGRIDVLLGDVSLNHPVRFPK